ncbi:MULTISPECIES: T6SS effector BTH_I2691 family protein [unclassified Pseudomonas]|uniref:T6SS effector BTH_I2691 family protein n=1 Tax=unclassified Pseudomonas TaxID=196821 RepID=UPI000BDD254F|nr:MULTISPECIES: T6SS effector BTH_I2691 family protein [unclassified Pseudomonas]PVZ12413.1 hypothetical protein F474_03208 [Pseudomonas sp. URIL14HWK12:I12]PVZ23435.1 hypothetical protein F470_02994 [Pseudomonas sp. URIL14HWK12:I10]PVZ32765.1 hypothetical protein F472_03342 [Pseudomonas sp. URIL14HWK12:I11]SNZ14021.1 hypothetical protein SAMN05660463_02691 [Pseudomonas sp. URIL14HWK12:I9]
MQGSLDFDTLLCEADPLPEGQCAACGRTGLPVLLLRKAFAPRPSNPQPQPLPGATHATAFDLHLEQLRTLRQGYVYVLLDARVWQAYEVSEQGTLRQFMPLEMPLDRPAPLAEACVRHNHMLPAAFVTFDTQRYSRAWVAFANDPWPRAVLDRYKQAIAAGDPALSARFHELNLASVRQQPQAHGIAMTGEDMKLGEVLEHAADQYLPFTSAHGYYSRRFGPEEVFREYIATLMARENLPNGVLALALEDPVGVVQEVNAQRLLQFQAMQAWRSEPQRQFELFTSQALVGIRGAYLRAAAQQAEQKVKEQNPEREKWNQGIAGDKNHLRPLNVKTETTRQQKAAIARLEERYDESARAAFESGYAHELNIWQASVDALGRTYKAQFESPSFALIAEHDYDPACALSMQAFILMQAAVLAGGPTEQLLAEGQAPGATQQLWLTLLEDHDSLIYQALLAKQRPLIELIQQGLAGDDLGKAYDAIKSLITSDEGKKLMAGPVQDAIGQLLAAVLNAQHTLAPRLRQRTRDLIGHTHSAALLRYAGLHMSQLVVSLTPSEYLRMLDDTVQTQTRRFADNLDQQLRNPLQNKLRATVLNTAFTAAIAYPNGKFIDVTLWALESAESLKAKIMRLSAMAKPVAGETFRTVALGSGGLQGHLAKTVQEQQLTSGHARGLAIDTMDDTRRALAGMGAGKSGLLLSLGGVWFQQDSLLRNYSALQGVSGPEHAEAVAAVGSATLGVIGMGVEAVGGALKVAGSVWGGSTHGVLRASEKIISSGGFLASLSGAIDSVQYFIGYSRTSKKGDVKASHAYFAAGLAAGVSSAILASYALGFAIVLFPLASGLILILVAYALYWTARKNESTSLEQWVRRCNWGLPAQERQWQVPLDMDSMINELHVALVGASAELSVTTDIARYRQNGFVPLIGGGPTTLPVSYLVYSITLPNFKIGVSRCRWEIYTLSKNNANRNSIFRSDSAQDDTVKKQVDRECALNNLRVEDVQDGKGRIIRKIFGCLEFDFRFETGSVEIVIDYWVDQPVDPKPMRIQSWL